MLQNYLEGVISEDICGEADDRWRLAGGKPRMQRAKHLIARNRVDPQARRMHFA